MEELSKRLAKMIEFSLGCTEPAAVAYNTAHLAKYIKNANSISVEIDRMTFKNAFAAGIPNSKGLTGAKNAALLGYLIADTSKGLEIFEMLTEEILDRFKKSNIEINIELSERKELYILSTAKDSDGNYAEVLTRKTHTGITEVKYNGEFIFKKKAKKLDDEIEFEDELFDSTRWEEIVEYLYKDEELKGRVKRALDVNLNAIEYGKKYLEPQVNPAFGAIYARMGGDNIEISSCAGSGNKGIVAIGAVSYLARKMDKSEEKTIKAVILSCLITSLITSKFGFVSSECGVVHAAGVGLMAAILYLDNRLNLFYDSYKNYIEGVGGVFCDGAKRGCSMKGYTASEMALKSIALAKNSTTAPNTDGFLGKDFRETIYNLLQYDPYFKLFDRETIDILQRKT